MSKTNNYTQTPLFTYWPLSTLHEHKYRPLDQGPHCRHQVTEVAVATQILLPNPTHCLCRMSVFDLSRLVSSYQPRTDLKHFLFVKPNADLLPVNKILVW